MRYNKIHQISRRQIKREYDELTKSHNQITRLFKRVTRHFFKLHPDDEVWDDFTPEYIDSIKPNPKPIYKEKKDG